MGLWGLKRQYHVDIRVNCSELLLIEKRAREAGYKSPSAYARDLIMFSSLATPVWQWVAWGFTPEQAEQIERAASFNGSTPFEWLRKVVLFWSEEPRSSQLKSLNL